MGPPRTISRQLNHCELAVAHIPKFRATCEGGYAVRDAIVTTEGPECRRVPQITDWHHSCTFVPRAVRVRNRNEKRSAWRITANLFRRSNWRIRVNLIRRSKLSVLLCAIAVVVFASSTFAATASKTRQLTQGEKAKASGVIPSRDGDLVRGRDKKSREGIVVSIVDATHIQPKNPTLPFHL